MKNFFHSSEAKAQNNRKNNLIGSVLGLCIGLTKKTSTHFVDAGYLANMLLAKDLPCQPCEFVGIYWLKHHILWFKVYESLTILAYAHNHQRLVP